MALSGAGAGAEASPLVTAEAGEEVRVVRKPRLCRRGAKAVLYEGQHDAVRFALDDEGWGICRRADELHSGGEVVIFFSGRISYIIHAYSMVQ